jgi:hypothetical protein
MPQPEKVLARIQSLDERLARLRTEKNRLIARAGHAERKRDTRRKILIGGAVLAAIDHESVPVMREEGGRGLPPSAIKANGPQRSGGQGGPSGHREAARSVLGGRVSEGHKLTGPKGTRPYSFCSRLSETAIALIT